MALFPLDVGDHEAPITKPFGRERAIHEIFGGGKVADVLLWRNKMVSGAFFIGVLAIWFLFEVAEYNLVTFLCHLTITTMLVIFIWSNGAKAFKWPPPPDIPKNLMKESTFCKDFCKTINLFLSRLIYVACGDDIKLFCLAILVLSILSTFENYISTLDLLFIGFLCMGTLPFLYERHEEKIDYLVHMLNRRVSKIYKMFEINFLSKIPRKALKEKKFN